MSAPDFYFAIQAIAKHLHDRYGMRALVDYWRALGRDYYRPRWRRWKHGGPTEVAEDWHTYFQHEPGADVEVLTEGATVTLEIRRCPAIAHLRASGREIVPYFCDHCDHTCGAMADAAGFRFRREGGMGTCRQTFVQVHVEGKG